MKSDYFILLLNDIWLCKHYVENGKIFDKKFVLAQCTCINDGI